VTVTELVGWEHSMKNELIIASRNKDVPRRRAAEKLDALLNELGLSSLQTRFFTQLERSSRPTGSAPAV
jgi:hypothetical protein